MPRERPDESTVDSRQSTQDEAAAENNGAAAEAQPTADSGQPAEVDAEAKAAEYLDLAQRTQADFENYRKRAAKDMAAAGARAKAGLLRELLPVVDNIERALGAVEPTDDG